MKKIKKYLKIYLRERPLFLAVLRAKEAALYQSYVPLKRPILDVGCGDGFFARVAFGKKKIGVGLDTEGSRITQARASGVYKRVMTYDGYTFPFRNRSFATVVVNSVLEHVDDLPRMLGEIRRVMRPGGKCLVTVMAQPWEQNLFGAIFLGDLYRRMMKKKQVHNNLLSHDGWRRAFVRAKFKPMAVVPYLSARAIWWLDVLHYVSLPSLVSYAFTKKWVLWPQLTDRYPSLWLAYLTEDKVSADYSGALFWELKR